MVPIVWALALALHNPVDGRDRSNKEILAALHAVTIYDVFGLHTVLTWRQTGFYGETYSFEPFPVPHDHGRKWSVELAVDGAYRTTIMKTVALAPKENSAGKLVERAAQAVAKHRQLPYPLVVSIRTIKVEHAFISCGALLFPMMRPQLPWNSTRKARSCKSIGAPMDNHPWLHQWHGV